MDATSGFPEDQTVAERIHLVFESLTRSERKLANAILSNYPMSGLGTITALAESAGVSTPTVVRMVKKLGFDGYARFQAQLRRELEATLSSPLAKHDRWADGAPETHILNRFTEAVIDNIRQTLRHIRPEDFNTVARLLSDGDRHLFVVGGRITQALAGYFFTHMQVNRGGLTLIPSHASAWPHYVLDMKRGDVLVAFDIRRYETEILHLTEAAAQRGAKLVLLTDQWGSPAAKNADHVFHIRIEVPSAWDSSVASLLVVEALIAAVETATWDSARERLKVLEALFDKTRTFRRPG